MSSSSSLSSSSSAAISSSPSSPMQASSSNLPLMLRPPSFGENERESMESPRIVLSSTTTFRSTILMDEFSDDDMGNESMLAQVHHKELCLNSPFYDVSQTSKEACAPKLASSIEDATVKDHPTMILGNCPPMLDSFYSFYSLSSPSHLYVTILEFCNSSFDEFDIAIEKDRKHGRLRGKVTERIPHTIGVMENEKEISELSSIGNNAEVKIERASTSYLRLPAGFSLSNCSFEISLFNAPSTSCPHRIVCEIQCRTGDRDLFTQFFNLLTNHLGDCIIDRCYLPQLNSLAPPFVSSSNSSSFAALCISSSSSLSSFSSLQPPSYDCESEFDLDLLVFKQLVSNSNTAVNVDV